MYLNDAQKRLLSKTTSVDAGHPTKCWEWNGEKDKYGYGRIKNDGKYWPVHWIMKGKPKAGLEVDHLCRNRSCVRPSHLEYVTRQENLRRRDEHNRQDDNHPLDG